MTVKQLRALLDDLPEEAHVVIAPTRFIDGRTEVHDLWRDTHGAVCLVTGPDADNSDWEAYRADKIRKQTQSARRRLTKTEEVASAEGQPTEEICECAEDNTSPLLPA
jgi:hypothetical protein